MRVVIGEEFRIQKGDMVQQINCMSTIRTISNNVMSEWARWRLKSTAARLFAQPFVQAQIKENTKVTRHWPF